jgi:hypothetical protein
LPWKLKTLRVSKTLRVLTTEAPSRPINPLLGQELVPGRQFLHSQRSFVLWTDDFDRTLPGKGVVMDKGLF